MSNGHEEMILELARKLKAAHVSYREHVTLPHAYNSTTKHLPKEHIGEFWIEMAQSVIDYDLSLKRSWSANAGDLKGNPEGEKPE
ncbi:MAG: hypothetical protein HYX71_12020 [Opitutae bacterium]|nr:hypothetical protein [Opitutae bacterium]